MPSMEGKLGLTYRGTDQQAEHSWCSDFDRLWGEQLTFTQAQKVEKEHLEGLAKDPCKEQVYHLRLGHQGTMRNGQGTTGGKVCHLCETQMIRTSMYLFAINECKAERNRGRDCENRTEVTSNEAQVSGVRYMKTQVTPGSFHMSEGHSLPGHLRESVYGSCHIPTLWLGPDVHQSRYTFMC